MKNVQETRTLFGGVDSDSAPYLIEKGMLLNSVNMRAITNRDQGSGRLEPVAQQTALTAVNTLLTAQGGTYTLIGKVADEVRNQAYFCFFANTGTGSLIVRYDITSNVASVFFRDDYVIDGLQWNSALRLSIRIYDNLFIFTDGTTFESFGVTNGVRYLDLNRTYTSGTPILQTELSLITEPFYAPLKVQRITDTATDIATIQRAAMQFTYRVINANNFVSVLAMYSDTVQPERESNIATNSSFGNAVVATVNKLQKIPDNWKQVDFIVRYLNDNTYYVIKSFYRANAADVTDVTNHNSVFNPYALNSGNFYGSNLELLDDVYKVKQFDVVPVASKYLEVAENRLLCANNVIGYDPSPDKPLITVTTNSYAATEATSNITNVYFLYAMDSSVIPNKIYAGLFVELPSGIFALPREISQLIFTPEEGSIGNNYFSKQDTIFPYTPSQFIPESQLIPMITPRSLQAGGLTTLAAQADAGNNGRNINTALYPVPTAANTICSLVWELHKLGTKPAGTWNNSDIGIALFDMGTLGTGIYIQDDPLEYYDTTRSKAFLPNSKIKYGIRFFDAGLRTCSVKEVGTLTIPDFDPASRELVERVTFAPSLVSTVGIPQWATRFAITLSKENICTQFLMFSPNVIKAARIDNDGVKTIDTNIFNIPSLQGGDIYGLAVPLASLQQQNSGYAYAKGDSIRLSFGSGVPPYSAAETFIFPIIDSFDGHLIAGISVGDVTALLSLYVSSQYNSISNPTYDAGAGVAITSIINSPNRQTICYATILQQPQIDFNQYEVAVMGLIASNTIVGFYDPGTGILPVSTVDVFGDCYTQKRVGSTGAFTGFSMTTNETSPNLQWVDIYGRIAPFTVIGQKNLMNEVRWGNVGSTQTSFSGLASFDASDYKLIDVSAGAITQMILTSRDIQSGGQLVILCTSGSFTGLVGQQQFYNADNSTNVTASAPQVLNVINPIKGGWGCQSPKSVVAYDGLVFWVDAKNRRVIQFSQAGADVISRYKNVRLWRQLLQRSIDQNNEINITGGLNPYSSEYIVCVPTVLPVAKTALPTVPTLEDPLDFYYNQNYSYAFNWEANRWNFVWDKRDEIFNVDQLVFGWNPVTRLAYNEFRDFTSYTGGKMIVTIPFGAEGYPTVYSPLSLKIDATKPPDQTWIQCDPSVINGLPFSPLTLQQVAGIDEWSARESDYSTAIRKNRLSNNATTPTTWEMAGVNGWSIKGKIVAVILVWNSENGFYSVSSATLSSRISSGH